MALPGVPNDTRREVQRRVIDGLRRLGAEGRLSQTIALCRAADELAEAGIRLREGAIGARQMKLRVACFGTGKRSLHARKRIVRRWASELRRWADRGNASRCGGMSLQLRSGASVRTTVP